MPKRADGPSMSGGIRFGSLSAFRANLPANAIKPSGKITAANAKARRNLSNFAAYPERAKSIGEPLPATQGISKRRAAALHKIEEVQRRERAGKSVLLLNDNAVKLQLFWTKRDNDTYWFFIKHDLLADKKIKSRTYFSRNEAMWVFRKDQITWKTWLITD